MVVLRVEIETDNLYPDEDFIANCIKQEEEDFEDVISMIDLVDYKHHWSDSYEHNGLAAHKGTIKPYQILDHITLNLHEHFWEIMNLGGDSMPIQMNHMVMAKSYNRGLNVLFETRNPTLAAKAAGDMKKNLLPI